VSGTIDIRVATVADAELIAELGARTFAQTFAADNTEEDMSAYLASAFSPSIQSDEIGDPASVFLLAEADGEAVGYARLRLREAPTAVGGRRPIEIARFYADRRWLGRGVGAALMKACLRQGRARGCDVIWLDVWERNPRAIAFYEKWGFTVVGGQSFVLGADTQSDLLMSQALVPDA
jgi:GNAT superfamily N-acetyltransferase